MEAYCNQNTSERRNYHNLSERSKCNVMNCANNSRMHGCDGQMGRSNPSMMNRERMAQQHKREEKMEQCRNEERMMQRRNEECREKRCETDDRDHDRSIEVECVCRVTSEMDCHRHDEMEKLGYRFPVVMSYVPWQQWGDLYDADCGLMQGTIFKDLNFIFCGERCL